MLNENQAIEEVQKIHSSRNLIYIGKFINPGPAGLGEEAYEVEEVPPGIAAHKVGPEPQAWGYFKTRAEAARAIRYDTFPSHK